MQKLPKLRSRRNAVVNGYDTNTEEWCECGHPDKDKGGYHFNRIYHYIDTMEDEEEQLHEVEGWACTKCRKVVEVDEE